MSGYDLAVGGALGARGASAAWPACSGCCAGSARAPSREFWIGLRVAQALAIAYALLAGVLLLTGDRAANDLYYLYALLPIAVGFVAEQLRIVAADHVLDRARPRRRPGRRTPAGGRAGGDRARDPAPRDGA